MRYSVMFKTPNALNYILPDYDEDLHDEIRAVFKKYVEYGEYITVVFDTDELTAEVV